MASGQRNDRPRVVVVGAGFGGLKAVRALGDVPVDITVIDRRNHHLFQPLLYQVATAGLSPADIAFPIRSLFERQPRVEVLMREVYGVDLDRRRVLTRDSEGDAAVAYDYLVIATGSEYNYFGHDEWKRFAPKLKSIPDATAIREKILYAFEAAEGSRDEAERRAWLTFVLVGAGPTGVEMAGAVAELAHRVVARDFRKVDTRRARILLLDALPRILTQFPESLARKAEATLEKLGVEVRTGAKVVAVEPDGVRLEYERIEAKTVIWTAGVKASPAGQWLEAPTDRGGRVRVLPDLSVPQHPEVFVIGDTACVYGEDGKPLPGLAPVAMQQGEYVAQAIEARLEGETSEPFRYRDKGSMATIGRSSAIVSFGKLKLSGMIAWLLWLGVHIFYLIGFKNRISVFLQWVWAYVTFRRGARLITFPEADRSRQLQVLPGLEAPPKEKTERRRESA